MDPMGGSVSEGQYLEGPVQEKENYTDREAQD